MQILYHITPEENLSSIFEHGLIPKIGERSALLGESEMGIYCFRTLVAAEDACGNWLGDCFSEDSRLALLKIKFAGTTLSPSAAGFETIVKAMISASCIEVLSRDVLSEVSLLTLDREVQRAVPGRGFSR
ncbi:hypothetical protein [Janthinobacterium sp. CAN_S7]|uniref:hypothetical protein n=1 Tax=Janthinobacterium sp. CAN_S7 TaxID=3071704 RepID=UPI00319E8870